MFKKILGLSTTTAAVLFAVSVFAQTTSPTPAAVSGAKIACVGAAVNARETTLGAGISAYT